MGRDRGSEIACLGCSRTDEAFRGRNVERDARKERELRTLGWRVLVVWQCETSDAEMLADRLREFLG